MKNIFWGIENIVWLLRCHYALWLHGPYGLSRVIERMPFRFIIKYLRKYGANIGNNCHIERGIDIHRPFGKNKPYDNLVIGDNVYIGHNLLVDLSRKVTIKNAASLGSRVQIWTHSGYYAGDTVETRRYGEDYGEVVLEEGAIIYSGSLLKHGVTIGTFAVVTACSMVNKDVEAYATASGVPIRVIRKAIEVPKAENNLNPEPSQSKIVLLDQKAKTIMIFGAGINQLELIRGARELGVTSVVLDPLAEPYAKNEADYFYQVGGSDYETTRELAIKHKVDGIVTGQMENPMRLMAQLAKELDLTFHSPEVTEQCLDKWLMKSAFLAAGVPCAKGIMIGNKEELDVLLLKDFNFPLILKPRDAYSSRGVYKTDSFEEILQHIDESLEYSKCGCVIIEEFMAGREFSVETITWNGETQIIQFTEKFITPYPNTVELAHLQPATLSEEEKNNITRVVISGVNALGINNSAAHSEVMLTHLGPKIIEIGARLGGDFISSYLTRASTGISMDKAVIQMALNSKPDLQKKYSLFSHIRYLELPVNSKVLEVKPVSKLLTLPGVVFAHIYVTPGDIIQPITHSGVRPACIIVQAHNKPELDHLTEEYLKTLEKHIIMT